MRKADVSLNPFRLCRDDATLVSQIQGRPASFPPSEHGCLLFSRARFKEKLNQPYWQYLLEHRSKQQKFFLCQHLN